MPRKLSLLVPIALVGSMASVIGVDYALLRYEKKPVHKGFAQAEFHEAPTIFEQGRLEQIAMGEDVVPGLPEEGAMCAKHVRATANSLMGSEFFMHHRLTSKAVTNIFGIDNLPTDEFGFTGDAWDMYFNLQEKGGRVLYSTSNPVGDKAKSIDFLNNNAKIGDVVGFYYPDSQYNETARKAGAGFTHMGIIVGFEKSARRKPIISHMFHSQNYFENQPTARYDTMDSIERTLAFRGYLKPLDFQKSSQEHQYMEGEPLFFVKAIVRPVYNISNN